MSLKKVIFLVKSTLIFSIIFATALIMLYVRNNLEEITKVSTNIYHKNSIKIVDEYFKRFTQENLELIDISLDNLNLTSYIDKKDKNQFYKEVVPFYKKYLANEPSLLGMHIILKDKSSFIKVELANSDDDFVILDNSFLDKALKSKKIESLLQKSNKGYYYRVVYPLFYKNTFLGVADFSYNVTIILDEIKKYFDFEVAILSKENQVFQSTTPLSLIKDIKKHRDITTFYTNNHTYDIKTYQLENIVNGSKIISIFDITLLKKQNEASLYKLLFILVGLSLVIILFVNFILNIFVKIIKSREKDIKSKTEEIYFNSRHNSLTNLPNLNVINEEITIHECYSVLMLNIDNVAILNTTYGTDMVDNILKATANYLKINLPSNATLYHMSAHEFAVILDNPSQSQEMLLCSQIKSYFEHTPIELENITVHIQFSMGIGVYDEKNKLNTFSQANIALVESRHKGSGTILMYDEEMSRFGSYAQLAKNIAILQKDLEDESLTPFFQPIVDNKTCKIYKYEVLARIKDENGFIPPHKFMEAAQVAGLLTAITKQIIQKSFQYFDSSDIAFSINITKDDLLENYLINFLENKTKKHNLKPENITLEILEDIATENNDEIIGQINKLSSLGYIIAIDDFGVESSNVSKLSDLDADFIKIDGSFIKDMNKNEKHLHIVESLVFMAQKLDMKIIAEFVHSEEIYQIVKRLGIDYSQGYYFSEPKESIDFDV